MKPRFNEMISPHTIVVRNDLPESDPGVVVQIISKNKNEMVFKPKHTPVLNDFAKKQLASPSLF